MFGRVGIAKKTTPVLPLCIFVEGLKLRSNSRSDNSIRLGQVDNVGFLCLPPVFCDAFWVDILQLLAVQYFDHMCVSLNGGIPSKHPKIIIFSRKTHGCWVPPF